MVTPGFVRGAAVRGAGGARARRSTCARQAEPSNLIGVHALVFSGGLSEEDMRRAAAGASAAGFDVLELALLERDLDCAMIRSVADEHGLTLSGSLGLTFDTDISSEDTAAVARGEEVLQDALRNTVLLGNRYMGGVLFGALGKYAAPATEAGMQNCISVLRRLAQQASSSGVTLGLEPCNRFETNVINTVGDACRLIDHIGEDNVVVHADSYHMNIEEDDIAEAVRTHHERIGYVHVGASHRGYLPGSVDMPGFLYALADVGYDGVITFESFSSKVVHPMLSEALAIWKEPWTDSADVALKAREYIRRELAVAFERSAASAR